MKKLKRKILVAAVIATIITTSTMPALAINEKDQGSTTSDQNTEYVSNSDPITDDEEILEASLQDADDNASEQEQLLSSNSLIKTTHDFGKGKEEAYEIHSGADFAKIESGRGKNYVLCDDIAIDGPVTKFQGKFDGCGHIISKSENYKSKGYSYYDASAVKTYHCYGLVFDYINCATIMNLKATGELDIDDLGSSLNKRYLVGGLIGYNITSQPFASGNLYSKV